MIITVWGASRGHYHKEFQLTMSQRTLMLQTISYFVYLLAGSAVYSHIEGWPYLDAVYWADFTLLTVGVGDFAPATHLGRSLLFPFAIGGIIILSLVIGSIRSLVLERGKVKMGARMVEKERQHILKMMERKNKDVILEPVAKTPRNISPLSMRPLQDQNPRPDMTERQRRQEEFELMRKIQEKAHRKRRWTSLVISGTVWFVLWFVGAAIFEQTEYVQSWSYFYALYFSYTSLLTIGYGDLYPVSSSGRAFFVFWSLLAVPSLTILISSMGDTIVKGIRDLTLWVGGFTVLPGEQGVKASLKKTASRVSRGRLFDSSIDTQETPPGFLGESTRRGSNISLTNNNPNNNPESAAQRLDDDTARMESSQAKKHQDEDVLPKAKHHYHYLLIEEISKVMQHIHSSPPRKYTFEEWAWYLRLVGEDESDADGHRRARKKVKPGEVEADAERWGKAKDRDNSKAELREWSWVGVRSPLMGEKDEAEWILERLTRTLKRELEGVKIEKEEAARKGRGRVGEVEDAQV
jgi:potassium channel subfamily K